VGGLKVEDGKVEHVEHGKAHEEYDEKHKENDFAALKELPPQYAGDSGKRRKKN